jgi:hypothetical protein
LGEDTKPYERSELGGVGEGYWAIGRAEPLTQLRVSRKLLTLRNPLPMEEGQTSRLHPDLRRVVGIWRGLFRVNRPPAQLTRKAVVDVAVVGFVGSDD